MAVEEEKLETFHRRADFPSFPPRRESLSTKKIKKRN